MDKEIKVNSKEFWKKRIKDNLKELLEEIEKEDDFGVETWQEIDDRVQNCIWWRY